MSNPNIPIYKKPAIWIVSTVIIVCLAVVVFCLPGVFVSDNLGAKSELDGMSISIKALDTSAQTAGITVVWNNKTEKDITYGEAFRLYRLENGQLVDTDLLDNRGFDSVGYTLSPNKQTEKHFSLKDYDLTKDGAYCFESAVNIPGDTASYKVSVGFAIEGGTLSKASRNAKRCTHAYLNATCTVPKTCVLCQSAEGESLGHDWEDATCVTPKTCRVCAATEGSSIPHVYVDATCEMPKTCSACGETFGDPLGHTASEATCTADSVCAVCKAVIHKALGHDYTAATCTEDGVCTRCAQIGDIAHGHAFSEATCTEDGICSYCGEIGDPARGHQYSRPNLYVFEHCDVCGDLNEDTCFHGKRPMCETQSYTCSSCGEYISYKGHTYSYGRCIICGADNPDDPNDPWMY